MKKIEWTTEKRKVNDLVPLEINPRKISEAKRMKMIESLQKFNLVDIPVIDKNGTVISGHQRLKALQAINRGEELIDVRIPNRKLTPKEIKEYNILANTHFGEFDFDVIDTSFGDIDFEEIGVELPNIDMSELTKEPEPEAKEDDFEVPDEDKITTDIVEGDLFEIGEHRLMCGDSTKAEDVVKLMGGELADMVFTDPPYGVNDTNNKRVYGKEYKRKQTFDTISNDNLNPLEFKDFTGKVLLQIKNSMQQNCVLYICTADKPAFRQSFEMACENQGFNYSSCLIWNKGNFGFGFQNYRPKHECLLYYKRGSVEDYWVGGQDKSTIIEIAKDPNKEYKHPTQKPIKLSADLINNHSFKSVLDLFLGSGSTMVAAHQLNRKCYGMELDPKYCQVIIDRMLKLDPALKITKNGKPWNIPQTN